MFPHVSLPSSRKGYNEVANFLREYTKRENVLFFSSASCAIFFLCGFYKKIAVPDQGAYEGFINYPKFFGCKVVKIKTDLGVVDTENLKNVLEKEKPEAFFVTSLAGYIAEQPMKEIKEICVDTGVDLIEDASGYFTKNLYGDTIVCSTGEPKIINLGFGGFMLTDNKEVAKYMRNFKRICKFPQFLYDMLLDEIKIAEKRLNLLIRYSELLKKELHGFKIVHKDKKGICVGILFDKELNKSVINEIKKKLRTSRGASLITTCPRYDRFLENGIVVEVKKLDVFKISNVDIVKIAKILKEHLGD